jgi:hypothetical protein
MNLAEKVKIGFTKKKRIEEIYNGEMTCSIKGVGFDLLFYSFTFE